MFKRELPLVSVMDGLSKRWQRSHMRNFDDVRIMYVVRAGYVRAEKLKS